MVQPRRVLSDLDSVRALAHPRRQSILRHLRATGPATSADLARVLDLNTGATSYHLRELAKHGFVEQIADRGRGRERWWQAVASDLRFPPRSEQSAELRAAFDEMTAQSFAADIDALARFLREAGGEWVDGATYSRSTVNLSVDEIPLLMDEFVALINKYARRDDPPEGTRPVEVRFLAFPGPD